MRTHRAEAFLLPRRTDIKWFKHMSDMSNDVRVKRLIRKYGVEGYGLYTYILERIVNKLETESPLPDLEETAGDIAGDLKMDTLRVEEIMLYAMEQGLFTQDDVTGRLVAHKVYKYLQQSETRSKQIRGMIEAYKADNQLALDCLRQDETVTENCEEQNRTEQNRKEEKSGKRATATHPEYGVPINQTTYDTLCHDYGRSATDSYILKAIDYIESRGKKPYADYASAARNYMTKDNVPKLQRPKRCPDCGKQYIGIICTACGWEE